MKIGQDIQHAFYLLERRKDSEANVVDIQIKYLKQEGETHKKK